jgi:hypothetical protein
MRFFVVIAAGVKAMSKILSGSGIPAQQRSPESALPADQSVRAGSAPITQSARIIGQPEGPYGTAAVARQTVLMRSLGAARFSKFETLEIAKHGLFVVCSDTRMYPYQTKSTLLEIQLFLGDPSASGTPIIKCVGQVENIRATADLPLPTPAGFVLRILQISSEDSLTLEKFVYSQMIESAI